MSFMQITINGQKKDIEASLTMENLIEKFCKEKNHVISELNGNIIKATEWTNTSIANGDSIELVTFVGGG